MHTLAHWAGKLPETNFMFLNFLKQITAHCLGCWTDCRGGQGFGARQTWIKAWALPVISHRHLSEPLFFPPL